MNMRSNKKDNYFNTILGDKNIKEQAIQSGGNVLLFRIVDYFIQMIGTILLARILTPTDFGLVAMVVVITDFFLVVQDMSLTEATIQQKNINHAEISTMFWVNLLFGIGIAIVVSVLSPVISWFYNESGLKLITIVISTRFIFISFSFQHRALLKRNMNFLAIALIEIIARISETGFALLLALMNYGYWALVVRFVMYSFTLSLFSWLICKWRPGLPAGSSVVRSMLKFGTEATISKVFFSLSMRLDKILIGRRYGAQDLGFYNKAYHLFMLPVSQLTLPFQHVAISTLSKLREKPERYRRYYLKAISIISFLGFSISAYLVSMSNDIILFLLGQKWIESAEIFSILGMGAGIQMVYATRNWLHSSLGKADRWLRWDIIGSLTIMGAVIIGLQFSPKAVAIAYTLSVYLLFAPGLIYAGKPIGIRFRYVFSIVWRYFVASGIAGLTCWYLFSSFEIASQHYLRLLFALIFFISVYCASIFGLFLNIKPITEFISLLYGFISKSIRKKS